MSTRTMLDLLDPEPLARGSRFAYGKHLRVRGVPAILLGVAAIVVAAGASAALSKATAIVPETLREARLFWLAVRRDERRELPS